jgi:hypothetical protein
MRSVCNRFAKGKTKMSNDDEIVKYLGSLLQHRTQCRKDNCRSCLTLQRICALIGNRIFSGPVYAEVMISATSERVRTRKAS